MCVVIWFVCVVMQSVNDEVKQIKDKEKLSSSLTDNADTQVSFCYLCHCCHCHCHSCFLHYLYLFYCHRHFCILLYYITLQLFFVA